jgi:hypothetical protein
MPVEQPPASFGKAQHEALHSCSALRWVSSALVEVVVTVRSKKVVERRPR